MRNAGLFILFITTIFFSSCKKDLLQFQSIQQLNSHTTVDRFNKILFVNNTVGFVVGGQRFYNATILMTTDGGYTWNYNSFPNAGKGLYGITQMPAGGVYVCGFDGKLLHTNNLGSTWSFNQMQYMVYTGLAFPTPQQGILVGGTSFNYGYITYIDSVGNFIRWDSLNYQLNCIKMANSSTGYICAYGTMLKTTNGGQAWNALNISGEDFTGIDITGNDIWVCGYNGSVYHSGNAGNSWQKERNGNDITIAHYRLLDIVFKDAQNGWAAGEDGVVIRTYDGGQHWSQYSQFTASTLHSIAICPNGDLLVAGDNGALYRLTGA
jgi:photosystem II stability/assembly factor-like uncharacterized protein